MPGGKSTYKDEQGNTPEEPPGGWYKTSLDTPHGRYLIDLIERGIISEVSKSNVVFRYCTIQLITHLL